MEPLQMNEKTAPELPQSWVWTTLGEICLNPQYGWTTSAKNEGYLHLLRTTDITSGNIDWDSVPFCKKEPPDKEKYLLRDNDIVISRAGSVGYSHLIKNPKGAVFASYLIRFKPLIGEQYTAYFLKSPSYWNSISEKSLGIAVSNVNATKLKQISMPLPPLPEQHRIVTKVEELFTQLDVGALTKARTQLKRYRQSVLKSACEGRLVPTEAELARADGRDYEPADVLLARIGKERREKWEAEKKRKGKKSAKYKEPAAPDVSDLPELPEGWVWTTFDRVSDRVTVGHVGTMQNEYIESGIPFLRSQNVRENRFDPNGLKFISREFHEKLGKSNLQPGDLVVVRSGSFGVSCVIPETLSEANCSDLVIVKQPQAILSHYGAFYMNSIAQSRINAKKTGVALIHFNTQSMAEMPVPLPPLAEQHRIVAEIGRRFSVADEIEKTTDQCLKQAERLRQSILKRAFEGKLVPQDSNDEPASVLLKRIKEEKVRRDAEEKAKKKSKTKPKRKKMKVRKDAETEKQTVELYEILRLSKVPLTLKELWQSSKLEIEDFYDQLKIEVEKGRIIERRRSNSDIFMEIVI